MDNLENKVDFSVRRSVVEDFATRPFTDKEWIVVASEIENILDHYLWSDLPFVIAQLPDLVAEHDKWDETLAKNPESI